MGYKVFLSVGSPFNKTQEAFISAIEQYLKEIDLIPQTVGRTYFSSLQPLRAVNELMRECAGTIIVALERSLLIEGIERRDSPKQAVLNGSKLPTPWNHIEAAMAYVHEHPLLVIVEDGVKNEGLLEQGYDWFVLELDSSLSPVDNPIFQGMIADWKKRVIQFAEKKSTRVAPPAPPAELTAEPAAPTAVSPSINVGILRRNMLKTLDDEELADLCFDMDIDRDSLRGENKNSRIRELILLCERNGRLPELLEHCRQMRPHIDWQSGGV
jgi:hypothetical protein